MLLHQGIDRPDDDGVVKAPHVDLWIPRAMPIPRSDSLPTPAIKYWRRTMTGVAAIYTLESIRARTNDYGLVRYGWH
jgi:hypothetical protein